MARERLVMDADCGLADLIDPLAGQRPRALTWIKQKVAGAR